MARRKVGDKYATKRTSVYLHCRRIERRRTRLTVVCARSRTCAPSSYSTWMAMAQDAGLRHTRERMTTQGKSTAFPNENYSLNKRARTYTASGNNSSHTHCPLPTAQHPDTRIRRRKSRKIAKAWHGTDLFAPQVNSSADSTPFGGLVSSTVVLYRSKAR